MITKEYLEKQLFAVSLGFTSYQTILILVLLPFDLLPVWLVVLYLLSVTMVIAHKEVVSTSLQFASFVLGAIYKMLEKMEHKQKQLELKADIVDSIFNRNDRLPLYLHIFTKER